MTSVAERVFYQLPIGVLIYRMQDLQDDRSLQLISANEAIRRVMSVEPNDLLGKNIDENFPGFRELGLPQTFGEVARSGQHVNINEIPYRDERVPMSFFSLKIFSLGNREIGITVTNITDRKIGEISLQESEERFRDISSLAGDYIWELDANGQYAFVSDRFTSMLGYSSDEVIGKTPADFMAPSQRQEMYRKLQDLFSRQEMIRDFEFCALSKNGREVWQTLNGKPVFDHARGLVGYRGLGHDITERRQHKEVIAEQRAQIETSAKLSALGEMAGGVAHEINNPLMVIGGFAAQISDLVTQDVIDRAGCERAAQKIQETIERIAKIVKGLRNFARDGSHDPFERSRLSDIIDETLSLCRARFRDHGIEIRWTPCRADLIVVCRPVQNILQVILNVLNNAHDAIEEMGARAKEKWVAVEVFERADRTEISVTDSGPGIPKEI